MSDERVAVGARSKTGELVMLLGMGGLLLLVQPNSAASQTAPAAAARPSQRAADDLMVRSGFGRVASGLLPFELLPSLNRTFKDAPFRTNRWGMRDKDYELKPPPRTFRIALLGSSFTMGGGVSNEQTHEALLEDRLNRQGPGAPRRHYEILNFAVAGYGLIHHVGVLDRKVFPFAPNAVLLTLHVLEQDRMVFNISRILRSGGLTEYPELRQKLQQAGLRPGMQQPEERRLLARAAPDLVRWSLEHIARVCREHGVILVGILFAEPRDWKREGREDRLPALAAAASAARIPVIDLKGVYDGHNLDSVRLATGDPHLNAVGHRLVADRLYELLRINDARTLKLGFPPAR